MAARKAAGRGGSDIKLTKKARKAKAGTASSGTSTGNPRQATKSKGSPMLSIKDLAKAGTAPSGATTKKR